MTLPNNQPPSPLPLFPITYPPSGTSASGGTGGNSIADLINRTQPNIMAILQAQMQASSNWNASTANVWSGLRRGTPGNPVPLLVAALEKFLQNAFGTTTTYSSLTALLTDAQSLFSGKWTTLGGAATSIASLISALYGGSSIGSTLQTSAIPNLSASKITSGTFASSLIPSLPASIITSGTFAQSLIPSLTSGWGGTIASSLLSGVLSQALIPSLTAGWGNTIAGSLLAGSISGATLPGANLTGSVAASLISGVLAIGNIPTSLLGASNIADLQTVIDALYDVVNNSSATGKAASTFKTSLQSLMTNLFGQTYLGTVLQTSAIPNLPASIITSGTLATAQIPGLDASKIVSGSLTGATVPGSQITGNVADAVSGVQAARDAIMTGLLGAAQSGTTNTQAQNANAAVAQQASNAAASAAAANAALAALQAQTNANNAVGGAYFNVQPSGADGATLPSGDWSSTGPASGDMVIRGANGYIGVLSSLGTGVGVAWGISAHAFTTDNQSLAVVLGDQGAYSGANLTIFTHANSAFTQGAYCSINNSGITVGSFTRNSSTNVITFTPFTGGSWSGTVSSGNRVELRNAGTSWYVLLNNVQIISVTSSAVTFGSSYRDAVIAMDRQYTSGFWGWGAGNYDAFRIAAVSISDYVVPTYVGSGARMSRHATATVTPNTSSGTTQLLPTSFFDTNEQATSDITVDLTNGKFTASVEGWYRVCYRIQFDQNMVVTWNPTQAAPILYKNGSVYEYGHSVSAFFYAGFTSGEINFYSSHVVYLKANDYVQVGYHNFTATGTYHFVGESTGAQTYFDIVLMNRSLA
jgi:hypothetical protein